jgi:hypothetical protein
VAGRLLWCYLRIEHPTAGTGPVLPVLASCIISFTTTAATLFS